MAISTRDDAHGLPIAAVEQATGIARATLRIWERRYGFPQPRRDVRDERSYGPEQVEKLRLIATLMASGHRPGRLVALSPTQLLALAGSVAAARAADGREEAGAPVLALLRGHDTAGLAAHFEEQVRSRGLARFVAEDMPRLNELVGDAWARGELQVFEGHFYSEAIELAVQGALAALPRPDAAARPRVLLATCPDEPHRLGLLMARAALVLQGCFCACLGARVPLPQIALAAVVLDADIVGMSYTASVNPAHVLRGLAQLRAELPARVTLWAGGRSPVLTRRRVRGVLAVRDIAEVPSCVARWRAAQD